jgi:hypothetical protein
MIAPPFVALVLGSQLAVTIADKAPEFDPAPGCRIATEVMPASFDACLKDEQSARAEIVAQWEQFAASDRASCAGDVSGGNPSYVELLTCLQMAREVRELPPDKMEGSGR